MESKEIVDFLIQKIKEYGYRRFCRDAEISSGTVSFWKHGKRGINVGTLILALEVLGYELKIVKKQPWEHSPVNRMETYGRLYRG